MESRLPRRPRIFAAQRRTRDAGRETVLEDDPWAGEDDAWTTDGGTPGEGRDEFLRFVRGAVVGACLGAVSWGLIALVVVLWLR
jgi:hypothetical protein